LRDVIDRMLKARRRSWIRSRPVFEPYAPVTLWDLGRVQASVGAALPAELREFLVAVGFGDVGEELSFRAEWFRPVESGELKGAVLFAQDISGNFYAYVPNDGRIVFFSRSEPGCAIVAANFREFVEELEHRGYKLLEWVSQVSLEPYAWQSA
jgi:hypothetical protein